MRRALPEALLAAMLTAVLAVPIFGLRIHVDGIDVSLDRTPTPVVVAVVIVFLLRLFQGPLRAAWARARPPAAWRNPLADVLRRTRQQPRYRALLWMLLLIAAVIWPFTASRGAVDVMTLALIYILMGLGLNIVVGFAGLLDLGYVAFFALGAYTIGILTSPEIQWLGVQLTWWQALPFAVLVGTLAGFILGIPVLQMRGDYLAIVTLGFGEIIRLIFLSDWLKPLAGGSNGITRIPRAVQLPDGARFSDQQVLFYVILAGILVAAFIATRLKYSRMGRNWAAMREDEDVAQAMGINLVRTKLMAFATGAGLSALSGAIFASKLTSVYPHSFNLLVSINILAVIIVGGLGSIPGVIVGALVLVGLPELLREFAEYRLLVYGAVLVFMMLKRPEGLLPEARRKLELHEATEA
jgi:branched-chain amino acid transport system permease protein